MQWVEARLWRSCIAHGMAAAHEATQVCTMWFRKLGVKLPVDAGQPPVVLVLQVAAVAEAHHLHPGALRVRRASRAFTLNEFQD